MIPLKVLVVFGTRPEAIKMAPVIKELEKHPERLQVIVCVTAQHREMLEQVLGLFGIRADYDLNVMRPDQTLVELTAGILQKIDPVLGETGPDWVLVQGDTTTTMAASLAAFYRKIRIGHVEAGLRTWNKQAPFPEEVNRKITSSLADLHFAPTDAAKANLEREGIPEERIWVTGNTVIDSLLGVVSLLRGDDPLRRRISTKFPYLSEERRLVLVTGHRRENFGEGLRNLCLALKKLAGMHDDVEIVYPVHLNPRVKQSVDETLGGAQRIHPVRPVDYLSFVYLMDRASVIITDSGGIQEEAPSLGKPVLVVRDVTERTEAVDEGCARLVGTKVESILAGASDILTGKVPGEIPAGTINPFGDGKASERIVRVLLETE